MARTFTLGTLVTRCQEVTDNENSTHVDTTEYKGYISSRYAELHEIHVQSGHPYYQSEQALNTDGTNDYALPSDYRSTVGIDYQKSADEWLELEWLMAQERNFFNGSGGAGRALGFRLVGSNIILHPTPPTGQTYRHLYVPQPADLSSAADNTVVDVISPTGEELIIYGVATTVMMKEETDHRPYLDRYMRARDALMAEAQARLVHSTFRSIIVDGFEWDPADYRVRRWS